MPTPSNATTFADPDGDFLGTKYYQSEHAFGTIAGQLFQILTHNCKGKPETMEWMIKSGSGFKRYLGFSSPRDLQTYLSSNPGPLSFSGMYKQPMAARRTRGPDGAPPQLEFLGGWIRFDVDADDAPWPLVALMLDHIDRVLKTRFGYRHVLKVHSGNRGGHVWVFDNRSLESSAELRDALVGYMNVPSGTGKRGSDTRGYYIKWLLENDDGGQFTLACFDFVHNWFIKPKTEGGVGAFDTPLQRQTFFEGMPERLQWQLGGVHLKNQLRQASAEDAWAALSTAVEKTAKAWIRDLLVQHVVSQFLLSIDENVTKDRKHMLKVPGSIHGKTGLVSMPICGSALEFQPERDLPHFTQLVHSHVHFDEGAMQRWRDMCDRFAEFTKEVTAQGAEGSNPTTQNDAVQLFSRGGSKPPPPTLNLIYGGPTVVASPATNLWNDIIVFPTKRSFSVIAESSPGPSSSKLQKSTPTMTISVGVKPVHDFQPFQVLKAGQFPDFPREATLWENQRKAMLSAVRMASEDIGVSFVGAEKTIFAILDPQHYRSEDVTHYNQEAAGLLSASGLCGRSDLFVGQLHSKEQAEEVLERFIKPLFADDVVILRKR